MGSTKCRPAHAVTPGGLSAADHERIHELARGGMRSTSIARAISKHPSTVWWYMAQAGLAPTRQVENPKPATRAGTLVRRFSTVEDDFLVAKRRENLKPHQIADAFTAEFGRPCPRSSVAVRLKLLASVERYDVA